MSEVDYYSWWGDGLCPRWRSDYRLSGLGSGPEGAPAPLPALAAEVRRGDLETLDGGMLPANEEVMHADGAGRDPALRRQSAHVPLRSQRQGNITASELRLSPGSPRAPP